jgi:glyoxylase-like metal-dependent hydrolase (beta-lactamase superfamily II)
MKIETIKTGPWKQNCYLIIDEVTKKCLIIDPGDDSEIICNSIDLQELKPLAIVNTHGHFDHVGAVEPLKIKYKIPFYLHNREQLLLKRANLYKMAFMKISNIKIPTIDELILDTTKEINIGNFKLINHFTPGHTNGGICLEINNYLFTGDTILESSLVPTNLPEENHEKLKLSVQYLKSLNPELKAMPGHGKAEDLALVLKKIETIL